MEHGHALGEAGGEALYGLGGEGDFRHQNDALFAHFYRFRQRLEIDLGLAAAGDAVQQKGLAFAFGQSRLNGFKGSLLGWRQGEGWGGDDVLV